MHKNKLASILLFASTLPVCLYDATAKPNEASQYIMSQPVSMLTYGIDKLQQNLNTAMKELGDIDAIVTYDWETDKIKIATLCYDCGLQSTEAACGELVERIRKQAGVKHGKATLPKGSLFSKFFEQDGYVQANQPKDLAADIDKMFVIKAEITENALAAIEAEGKVKLKAVDCDAPLLGEGFSVKRP